MEQLEPLERSSVALPIELSIVDLVLAATESSEDEFEINDGIAEMIESGAVRILSRGQDPMQCRAVGAESLGAELPELSDLPELPELPAAHPLAC